MILSNLGLPVLQSLTHSRGTTARSRQRPVAIVDGSLTNNLNEIGVQLWTDVPSSSESQEGVSRMIGAGLLREEKH